ncbi:type II secretion system protein [Ruficoccus amylovorans]|uniref:Type II secretion system protein n=1 Tax=Ruficoccus amylovorans TaxID=1804625 RepID=A0A842HLA8_9BACT|nr:type II secretion system protein [Ruficoccus amylovorans]MBC2595921.1 type II secretion system protein [Ruficoccus amylovorans]
MMRRRPNGFSLIELLTVIAVIGILAAIILPIIKTIQERSRSSACASNMRQLGQAILLYQAEHGSKLPPNYAFSGGAAAETWTVVVRPYLGIDDLQAYGQGTDLMCEALSCPSLEEEQNPDRWWESNYAVGIAFGTDGKSRTLADVDSSKVVMLAENNKPSVRCIRQSNGPWSYIGFNHDGYANIMFHDGHMTRWTVEDCPQDMDAPAWGIQ